MIRRTLTHPWPDARVQKPGRATHIHLYMNTSEPPDHPLRRELRRLLIALGYFTRVPIPAGVGWSAQALNRAARYFPLIGVFVGGVATLVLYAASGLLPLTLAVLMSMAASVLMTGAFHEDGLADAADGFGGGYDAQRVLEIMQDSRIGSYGAIAMVLVLLGKFSALLALAEHSLALAAAAVISAHAASRACALGVMAVLPYVRVEGDAKARPVAEGIGGAEWITGLVVGAAPLALVAAMHLMPLRAVLLAILATLAVLVVAVRYFRRRIGGYTGDCLGATQQVAELAFYFAACAWLG